MTYGNYNEKREWVASIVAQLVFADELRDIYTRIPYQPTEFDECDRMLGTISQEVDSVFTDLLRGGSGGGFSGPTPSGNFGGGGMGSFGGRGLTGAGMAPMAGGSGGCGSISMTPIRYQVRQIVKEVLAGN